MYVVCAVRFRAHLTDFPLKPPQLEDDEDVQWSDLMKNFIELAYVSNNTPFTSAIVARLTTWNFVQTHCCRY